MQKTKENRALIIEVLTAAHRVCLMGGGKTKFTCPALETETPAAPEAPEKQTKEAGGE